MIQFGWIEYGLVAFAFHSPDNLWLLDQLNYTALCGIMFFLGFGETCIRDIEIDRNWRSEELLKLGEGQKIFIFRGDLPYEGVVRKVSFSGGDACSMMAGSYPSAYYDRQVKGQKTNQNDKKFCLSCSISQEPYIIWLSFMVHLCKMTISPVVFF